MNIQGAMYQDVHTVSAYWMMTVRYTHTVGQTKKLLLRWTLICTIMDALKFSTETRKQGNMKPFNTPTAPAG